MQQRSSFMCEYLVMESVTFFTMISSGSRCLSGAAVIKSPCCIRGNILCSTLISDVSQIILPLWINFLFVQSMLKLCSMLYNLSVLNFLFDFGIIYILNSRFGSPFQTSCNAWFGFFILSILCLFAQTCFICTKHVEVM